MKLRAYLAITIACVGMLICDPVQRFLIAPWVRLFPSRRHRVLTAWLQWLALMVTKPLTWIGGASIPEPAKVPSGPGVLILMNHQSLVDIPLAARCIEGGYPLIVTRRRYTRWIPLISHLLRLYQYPVVDPTAKAGETRKMLRSLQARARSSEVPLVIFPEGTRSKDGDIGPFMTTGLRLILKARAWRVYVFVVDGYWGHPRLRDFLGSLGALNGRIDLVGEFEWSDPKANSAAFRSELRQMMVDRLGEMRGAPVG